MLAGRSRFDQSPSLPVIRASLIFNVRAADCNQHVIQSIQKTTLNSSGLERGMGMLMDLVARFLIGGVIVSAFAVIGSLLKPVSFAGLFGAAPSVALATLGLTIAEHGA